MPKADFARVRKLVAEAPGVEETTSWGQPTLKAGGKMFVCVPSHRSAESGSLVVMVDFERREGLLAEAPEKYYVKPHYVGYPCVLVRLAKVGDDELRGLLLGALEFVRRKQKRSRGV